MRKLGAEHERGSRGTPFTLHARPSTPRGSGASACVSGSETGGVTFLASWELETKFKVFGPDLLVPRLLGAPL